MILISLPFQNNINEQDVVNNNAGNLQSNGNPVNIENVNELLDFNDNKIFTNALYINSGGRVYYYDCLYSGLSFTVSCWFYIYNNSTPNIKTIIFIGSDDINKKFSVEYNYSEKKLYIYYQSNSNYIIYDKIFMNKWNNIIFCYNKNTLKAYCYINGICIKELNNINNILGNEKYRTYIGASPNNSSGTYLNGYIKYFRIYDNESLYNGEDIYLKSIYNEYINPHILSKNNYKTKIITTKSIKFLINTIKTVKWNQKINMYVMDPNIYKKG